MQTSALRRPGPLLSPTRAALAEHHQKLAASREAVARAEAPVTRLKDQLAAANAQLRTAEADLAAIKEQNSAMIRDAAKRGDEAAPKAQPTAKAEAAVENARRPIADIQAALAECEAEAADARSAHGQVVGGTEPLVLAVISEDGAGAVERLANASAEYTAAETEVFSILEYLRQHGSGVALDSPLKQAWANAQINLRAAWGKTERPESRPRDIQAGAVRWSEAFKALFTDPTARG
jgi:DNA repair exonuclease SbcCD ATPase subunit